MKFSLTKPFKEYYLEERRINKELNESSLSRLQYYLDRFDVAFITAQVNKPEYTYKINKSRNLDLRMDLEARGYNMFMVGGSYDNQETGKPDKEISFAVINKNKSSDEFIEDMTELGEKYNQESVLIFIDGKGSFYMTSGAFKGEVRDAGTPHFGKDNAYKSLVNGRPFVVESIELCGRLIKSQGQFNNHKK